MADLSTLHLPANPSNEYDVSEFGWRHANFEPCKKWMQLAKDNMIGKGCMNLKLPGDNPRWADYDFMQILSSGREYLYNYVSLYISLIRSNHLV